MSVKYNSTPDTQWRIALIAGAFPMLIALPFRWRMHETAMFERRSNPLPIKDRVMNVSRVEGGNNVSNCIVAPVP